MPLLIARKLQSLYYQNQRLANVLTEEGPKKLLYGLGLPLAEAGQHQYLLAVDHHDSPVPLIGTTTGTLSHTPYGYLFAHLANNALLAFNGEWLEPHSQAYLLGNGYRGYSPSLTRFHSPDSLSPFGIGGLNSYAYCNNDPINRTDPSGHAWQIPFLASARRSALLSKLQSAQAVRPIGASLKNYSLSQKNRQALDKLIIHDNERMLRKTKTYQENVAAGFYKKDYTDARLSKMNSDVQNLIEQAGQLQGKLIPTSKTKLILGSLPFKLGRHYEYRYLKASNYVNNQPDNNFLFKRDTTYSLDKYVHLTKAFDTWKANKSIRT